MISKIIQKEKERQEEYFNGCGRNTGYPYNEDCKNSHFCELCGGHVSSHKQSLINLKEYMEEIANDSKYNFNCGKCAMCRIKQDIKELTKMIERYE